MPGYASWKTLYKEEYRQLYEEGYSIGDHPQPDLDDEFLPFPEASRCSLNEGDISEAQWEQAYWNLWQARAKGLRADFPYREPEGYAAIIKAAGELPPLEPVSAAEYRERIKGAWHGRCAAVILGKPLEMNLNRIQIQEYLESVAAYPLNDWVPARSERLNRALREDCLPSTRGNVRYVQADDDIHYTILALLLAEKKGPGFTTLDVGMNWLDNVPFHWFWCASRQAYFHLVNLTEDRPKQDQVDAIPLKINPWRECIDGQLRGDLWGYLHPADPRRAAAYAHRECSLSLVKNGIYGGMFVAGCISAALSGSPTADIIIRGGLAAVPRQSRLAQMVSEVTDWYAREKDWASVCDKIYQKYGHLPFAATINNLAMVVLALLHGGLDFTKTVTTAVMCGIDTDCNSGTAGSIVGAAVGLRGIEERWIRPLHDTVKTSVAAFGEGKISDLAERTIRLRETFDKEKADEVA